MVLAILFTVHCTLFVSHAVAQTLTANAPSHVAVGEQFRLSYTVDTQDVSDFRVGDIPDAFEVLMGPSRSSQSSFQIINGHTSQSSSITFTYIVVAVKNGTFTIPAAHITAAGKSVSSGTLKISVSGQAQGGAGGGSQRQQQMAPQPRAAGTPISGSDLFIKVSANKKRVYEQEPILLTYKVYTLVDLTQLEGKMPELNGFHTQEVPLPQQKSFKIETLNGRPYRTVTWSQYVMFPQITGKLQIPGITFNGIVIQQNRNIDPFEAFFNGGSGYVEVKKQIQAPGIEIQVDPLPQRPANFSGGVGHFNISAQLDSKEVKANEALKLRVIVSGVGNLKLIKQPVVEFPKDFDRYDAKLTDKSRLTTNGVEGSMIYDFLAVPRHQGKFEIPAVEFTYYDTSAHSYKTVKTESFTIDVQKGTGVSSTVSAYTSQEDLKLLNKDIRYIKQGDTEQHDINDFFFGSTAYWVSLVVLALVFISLFIVFRQRAIDNADIVGKRAGRANKVATKRLKKSARLMQENRPSEFYDEVLRALWGYVGDKLNIPVEQLSHDNIADRLSARGTEQAVIDQFIGAIDECEFERYAPGDPKGNMSKVFEKAMNAIEKIENGMKKNKKRSAKVGVVVALMMMASTYCPLTAGAQGDSAAVVAGSVAAEADSSAVQGLSAATKAEADSAYAQAHYQLAVKLYEELLKQGVSTELYYNLGNAYYRMDEMPRAVLNYERALLLSPGDADVRFNLQMARSKTIDKITPESEMFFVTWYHSLVNFTSVDGWARLALVALALAIVLALLYLFADAVWLRKVGFFGALGLLLLFVVANAFAYSQKQGFINRSGAIIMAPAATVKSTPAKQGTDLFILHEGTKVEITDGGMRQWKRIRVADGKEGWVETSQIEVI